MNKKVERHYSITVPVMNDPDLGKFGGREAVLAELEKLGAVRVLLSLERYVFDRERRGKAMRALKENSDWFKARGLSTGAWLWAFWSEEEVRPPFCLMTERNGVPGPFFCPLDEDFRKFAADYVADIARTGVDMILYDDDYGYRNFSTGTKISCLCEKHLAAYRKELGEDVAADEFSRHAMSGGRNRWRDAWMKVSGESLVAFAKEMRAAVDSVNPKLRMGLCSVMSIWDNDGTDAPTIARALAGPDTRPFLRLIGAPYWAVGPRYYGSRLQNVVELERMQRSWVGDGIEVVAEGDAYPRPRYNCPAAHLELFDMAIRADGRLDGIMKYALDYHHHVDYERGYTIRHQRNAQTYDWIERNMSAKTAAGVRIYESLHKLRDAEIPEGDADSTAIFEQFGSSAGKLLADASIPTVYEGPGICGAAFGENVKQVPKEAFAGGLIVDRRGAELLEEMGVSVGLREKGANAPETFFHENADGGKFFIVNFDTKGPKGRDYETSRKLADAVRKLSGRALPAYVNGCPDLYVMVKRDGAETVIGLWNMFADSVLDGVVELDAPAGDVEFFNCTGRKDGDRLVIDEIPPFSFAGIRNRSGCDSCPWRWYDGASLPLEGRGYAPDRLVSPYHRLPADCLNRIPAAVRDLQDESAGLCLRFQTNSAKLRIAWKCTKPVKRNWNMPSSGCDGIDVYQETPEGWRFVQPPFQAAAKPDDAEYTWAIRPDCTTMVYLPAYNGVAKLRLGIGPDCSIEPAPPRRSGIDKPVVFYGTSITQGASASHPGGCWVARAARIADVKAVNLGFSGAGMMEDAMLDCVADIDASLYVLDTVSNMSPALVAERMERFLRGLAGRRPGVPILLTANCFVMGDEARRRDAAVREVFDRLRAEDPVKWACLHFAGDDMATLAPDADGTVDGTHLNDLGMTRAGDYFGAVIRDILQSK